MPLVNLNSVRSCSVLPHKATDVQTCGRRGVVVSVDTVQPAVCLIKVLVLVVVEVVEVVVEVVEVVSKVLQNIH